MTKEKKSEEKATVESIIASLEKQHGKGVVVTNQIIPGIERFSSGCATLDIALGGGWARGRIIELYGQESSSKSTLCLHATAEVQKLGGKVLLTDIEHSYDPLYSEAIGVDNDALIFSQPNNGEEALDIVCAFLDDEVVDLIVIDSVAALTPKAEIDGEMNDQSMGLHARLMSKAMRKTAGPAAKTHTTLMFTNQMREKMVLYGNPNTTCGGNALKFYASQRVYLKKMTGEKQFCKEDGQNVGININAKVMKNRTAPPFREATFSVLFGSGIDKYKDLLLYAVATGIVGRKGGHHYFNEQKLGASEAEATRTLAANIDLSQSIRALLK